MHTSSGLLPEKQVSPKDSAKDYLAGMTGSHQHMDNWFFGINKCPWEEAFCLNKNKSSSVNVPTRGLVLDSNSETESRYKQHIISLNDLPMCKRVY